MSVSVHSILQHGSDGVLVDAQCHITNGLPAIVIVGLGGRAIDEAKERLRGAFANAKLTLPAKRIAINLAPADIPKDSTALDLPISVAILAASQQIRHTFQSGEAFLGEVGLDGSVRPIRGIIGTLIAGRELGITTFYVPAANYRQASLVPGLQIIPISSLSELVNLLATPTPTVESRETTGVVPSQPEIDANILGQIVGQEQAKRALEIVAAGGHNILLSGPPGTGKSMLARALPSLLPPMSHREILETTHLHSLAGNNFEQLIITRPLRAPHHTASSVSVIGGGSRIRPGEISLSHNGVLFLDEMPEFNRVTLEALRQPLEERAVTIVRANQHATFPANFILVATANPCPCGYYNTTAGHSCQCSAAQILRYKHKLSGPILDRIDLHIDVDVVDHTALLADTPTSNKKYDDARAHITVARKIQGKRFGTERLNASMSNDEIKRFTMLTTEAQACLNDAARNLSLSARSYMRLAKIARTIADLSDSHNVKLSHVAEALQYRPKVNKI